MTSDRPLVRDVSHRWPDATVAVQVGGPVVATDGGLRLPERSRRRADSSASAVATGSLDNSDWMFSGVIYTQPRDRRKQSPESFANVVEDGGFRNESARSVVQKVGREIAPFQPSSGFNQWFWSISVHVDGTILYTDDLHEKSGYSSHKSVGGGVLQELDHLVSNDTFDPDHSAGAVTEGDRSVDTNCECQEGSQ